MRESMRETDSEAQILNPSTTRHGNRLDQKQTQSYPKRGPAQVLLCTQRPEDELLRKSVVSCIFPVGLLVYLVSLQYLNSIIGMVSVPSAPLRRMMATPPSVPPSVVTEEVFEFLRAP